MIRAVFERAETNPKWPMYLRNVKQLMKSAEPSFDEREYGFSSLLDVVRQCQRAGVFRLERNRQGVLRIFQGDELTKPADVSPSSEAPADSPKEPEPETPTVTPAPEVEVAKASVPADQDSGGAEATPEDADPKTPPVRKRKVAAKARKTKTTKATKTTKTTKKAVKTTRAAKTTKATKATKATKTKTTKKVEADKAPAE